MEPGSQLVNVLLGVTALILFVGLVILSDNLRRRILAIRFRRIFGAWPESHSEEDRALAQELINKKLEMRAHSFLLRCKGEEWLERLYDEVIPDHSLEEQEAILNAICKELWKTRTAIKKLKRAFWDAHGLAKHFGYEVGEKVKDHLPKGFFPDVPEPELG